MTKAVKLSGQDVRILGVFSTRKITWLHDITYDEHHWLWRLEDRRSAFSGLKTTCNSVWAPGREPWPLRDPVSLLQMTTLGRKLPDLPTNSQSMGEPSFSTGLACTHVCLVASSCLILCDPMDCRPPGSSVHGILQARTLEWVARPSSRGPSRLKDQTHVSCVSCITGRFFTH